MEETICRKFSDDLKKFQDLIATEKNLPQNLKPLLLLRYLKVSQFNSEQALKLLKINLEYRAKYPHIFTNRDMMSEEIQQVINTFQIYPLRSFTKEKYRVTMSRVIDDDSSKFDIINTIKLFFMISDVGFVTANDECGIPEGEIGILDFKGFTWWHLMKVATNISTVRAFLRYVQEAVPYKIIQNHYVNCSPVLTKMMILIKPFVKKELFDVMHFHTTGYESLHKFIPKEILPVEYGGSAGPTDSFFYQTSLEHLRRNNDYLKNDDNWKLSNDN